MYKELVGMLSVNDVSVITIIWGLYSEIRPLRQVKFAKMEVTLRLRIRKGNEGKVGKGDVW